MKQYERRTPVEAVQITEENFKKIAKKYSEHCERFNGKPAISIWNDGWEYATIGDWIIIEKVKNPMLPGEYEDAYSVCPQSEFDRLYKEIER